MPGKSPQILNRSVPRDDGIEPNRALNASRFGEWWIYRLDSADQVRSLYSAGDFDDAVVVAAVFVAAVDFAGEHLRSKTLN